MTVERLATINNRYGTAVGGSELRSDLGGAGYPGKKVPLSEGGFPSPHWHGCVAANDVMASGGDFNTQVITDLSLSALFPVFKAEPQGYALPADAWHTCPELR
ncbi:MAG: hypothetical protein OXI83_19020 [Gemmatimonadota bacterium]|nr:hypothetical protein [Gemmatimonadota bacterium]